MCAELLLEPQFTDEENGACFFLQGLVMVGDTCPGSHSQAGMEQRFDRSPVLSPPDTRLQGEKAEIISGFATGSQDFSCAGTLGSAGIRAWWIQPDHKEPPGAWGEPDPSTVQMGRRRES